MVVGGDIRLGHAQEYHKFFLQSAEDRYKDMSIALGGKGKQANEFIVLLGKLMKSCNVAGLKMSDYGIEREELAKYAELAMQVIPSLSKIDRIALTVDDVLGILERSYR